MFLPGKNVALFPLSKNHVMLLSARAIILIRRLAVSSWLHREHHWYHDGESDGHRKFGPSGEVFYELTRFIGA